MSLQRYTTILLMAIVLTVTWTPAAVYQQDNRSLLCPYPYLDMGTEPACIDMIFPRSDVQRVAAMTSCEKGIANWESAW